MPPALKPRNPIHSIFNGYNARTKAAYCEILLYAPYNWDEDAYKGTLWTVEGGALNGIHVDARAKRQAVNNRESAVAKKHSSLIEALEYLGQQCQRTHLACRLRDDFEFARPPGNRYSTLAEHESRSSNQRCQIQMTPLISSNQAYQLRTVDHWEHLPPQSRTLHESVQEEGPYNSIRSWALEVWKQTKGSSPSRSTSGLMRAAPGREKNRKTRDEGCLGLSRTSGSVVVYGMRERVRGARESHWEDRRSAAGAGGRECAWTMRRHRLGRTRPRTRAASLRVAAHAGEGEDAVLHDAEYELPGVAHAESRAWRACQGERSRAKHHEDGRGERRGEGAREGCQRTSDAQLSARCAAVSAGRGGCRTQCSREAGSGQAKASRERGRKNVEKKARGIAEDEGFMVITDIMILSDME
ncbi:hypothetical protein B0H12DRAFT_1067253 [Mycena haematopus]|nr:hypothetical protein B0H12DRAFT_1067253 [Mycena haematopus]